MLKKLEYTSVIGSIALIGADRIDLLGGHGFFRLTPFLLFAPLVVLIQIFLRGLSGTFEFTIQPPIRRQLPFLAVFSLFLVFSFVSTIFGVNPERGIVALADLVLVSVLGYCISVRILADPAPQQLVLRCITFALILWLIFCLGECIAWGQGLFRLEEEPSSSIESIFAPTATLLGVLPRLSGFSLDSNRAAFVLVMYLALLDRFSETNRYSRFFRFAIGVFVLLTFSRSGILCWFAYYFFSRSLLKHLMTRRMVLRVATLAIVCSSVAVIYRKEIGNLFELWQVSDIVSERLSGEQGTSGGNHIELIQRGLETWASSTRTVFAGIGFAGAPRVLGDFFGDSKYGNFHSLYVTVLAELGLPAFLLLLILFLYPVVARSGAGSFIAAIALFNLFLQSHMEPIFWVALAIVWSFEGKNRKDEESHRRPLAS
jgi:hypothetical protein